MCFPLGLEVIEKKWEFKGLQCAVTRHDLGGFSMLKHRCGYVRVPSGHPFHGKPYDDIHVDVHGGLTFAEIEPCEHEDGIGYWIGFDCAHFGDASVPPGDPESQRLKLPSVLEHGHYWTLNETKRETERLAQQVLEAAKKD